MEMSRLNPYSLQTGDIVLVLGADKDTPLIRAAQDLLRLPSILGGAAGGSRYSHVMLGVAPGVVIHADGKSVKMELLAQAIGSDDFMPDRIRIVRPNDPPLSDIEQVQVAFEARRFFNQKYSLIYGRKSMAVGRVLRDKRGITFPFCSELVATAYQAIGRPLSERPPDQTLPVDLERYCIPPGWRDVSSEFEALDPPGPIPGMQAIQVGDTIKSLEEWWADSEKLLRKSSTGAVEMVDQQYEWAKSMVETCALLQMAKSMSLTAARKLAENHELLFTLAGSTVESDIRALPDFYRQIKEGLTPEAPSIASALKEVFPGGGEESGPFEILPSFKRLAAFELQGESLSFGARALRLSVAMSVIAVALEVRIKGFENVSKSVKDLAVPYLRFVDPITDEEQSELLATVDGFSVPDATYTGQLRGMCANIMRLHRVLSILRPALDEVLSRG